jgi:hypothetical protein
MCPFCAASIALIAAGATSSGGLSAFALTKLYRRNTTTKIRGNENEIGTDGTNNQRKQNETSGNRIGG